MQKTRRTESGTGTLELTEEVFHVLRAAPLRLLAPYYIGALPFVMGLVLFWADMSMSAFAYRRAAPGALLLSLLFVWMKAWQNVYARGVWAHVCDEAPPRWGLLRFMPVRNAPLR